jgi:Trk K+ transport system NAD-binding subunit
VVISEGSPLVGRSLHELPGPPVPLLLKRHDGQLIANPPLQVRLEQGDTLVVYGETIALRPLD